jgi:hypothetical protein
MIAKPLIFSIILGTVVSITSELGNQPDLKVVEQFKESQLAGARVLKNCTGKTDYPHLSKHVPGTVNVEATVKCPGRSVNIALSLIRVSLGNSKTVTRNQHGFGTMTINLAMLCTWKRGVPFRYIASAVYTEASGAHATHLVFKDLNC